MQLLWVAFLPTMLKDKLLGFTSVREIFV
jgi:hypothetical protein